MIGVPAGVFAGRDPRALAAATLLHYSRAGLACSRGWTGPKPVESRECSDDVASAQSVVTPPRRPDPEGYTAGPPSPFEGDGGGGGRAGPIFPHPPLRPRLTHAPAPRALAI